MREAPIPVGKAYSLAASCLLQLAARFKELGDHEQAAFTLARADEVSKWARDKYGRSDTHIVARALNEKE